MDSQAPGEAYGSQKRTSSISKHENSSLFYICVSFSPSGIWIQQLKEMRIRIHNPDWGLFT